MRTYALITLFAVTAVGCSNENAPETATADTTTENTTPAEDSEMTDSSAEETATPAAETPVFVIDVRSKEEWDGGHVEQAAHIPHTEIADRIGEVTIDKSAKIVVYCAVGGRAGKAKEVLEGLGYTAVENGGGYDDVKDTYK